MVASPLTRLRTYLCVAAVLVGVCLSSVASGQPVRTTLDTAIDELGGEVSAAVLAFDRSLAENASDRLRSLLDAPDATPSARARTLYHLARIEESFGSSVEAARLFTESLRADPGAPTSRHARTRLRSVEARLSAGEDDEMRQRLDAIRSRWQDVESAEAARAEVEAMIALTDSPSLKAELHFWLASHALFRSRKPLVAWENYVAILELPGLPDTDYRNAIDGIIETCGDAWRVWASRDVVRAFIERRPDFFEPSVIERLEDEFEDAGQRRVAFALSWVGLIGLLVALVLRRAWRALLPRHLLRWKPWRSLFFLAWLFVGAGFFARAWDAPLWIELALVGAASSVVALAAGALRWADPEVPLRGWLRWAVALIILLSSFGAIFLPLEKIGREQLLGM